ncbi:MAG TPA: PatB family C-S lyase [Burkholderiales bacterium]|nr:PatB family C-S lyase [Burkholderiales bacterium]
MSFDFDRPVERAGSWSTRWDRYGPEVIPLWVADTDFRAPAEVLEALHERVRHGVLGYTNPPEELREAIVEYLRTRHEWRVEPSWLVFLPGVVAGLHLAARRLAAPGEHVLVPAPVYHHFKRAVELAPRPHTEMPLVLQRGRWVLDLDVARRTPARLAYLCNPQNPGGTVFSREELLQFAQATRDALIVADEIHCDLVLEPGCRHVPIASLAPEISRRTVTLMSANKAYNFPGAGCAWAVIEDAALREQFDFDVRAHVLPPASVFGYAATLAALRHGGPWLAAQLDYLRANRDLVAARLPLPQARVEATYLAWIDCSALPLDDPWRHFLRHGVALSPGAQFGAPGFVRLNFGTQRARLEQALERMVSSLPSAG